MAAVGVYVYRSKDMIQTQWKGDTAQCKATTGERELVKLIQFWTRSGDTEGMTVIEELKPVRKRWVLVMQRGFVQKREDHLDLVHARGRGSDHDRHGRVHGS